MTRQVFHTSGLDVDASTVTVGQELSLGGDEGHHAFVKRVEVGECIDLVDGQGLRLVCEIVSAARRGPQLRVGEVVAEDAPAPRIVLVQALAKGGRDEQAVETATEVGIDAVLPWQANRSIVRWAGPKADKARAKWEGVALAAAKQARRAWVPEVLGAVDSRSLARWARGFIAEGGAVLVCHEEAVGTLSALVAERSQQLRECVGIALVVGPEGGIDGDELDALTRVGATPVLLGPHVLRASTAGPVAAALVGAAVGRW
ncbi:16S rRNA (uracil(1498)-N(3))-methyltransferase [Schaalia sp. 19OD2882]|uniref:16S rRNA (uracil(1498)-N(3))-methyltransferase n=1 Tax=Schaalia sp. 19OD2882 TaxID=2794089 RepID=UPI001C1EC0FF|nr:16S rRNA (uracil(1498)-N(3))-methyltransferase [Schaalia sp. 19OD2882]QWW19036.1 16S rRNA (uracil(1498)-N(3))-methyltransferase [Schaalia sp. 19OD2882]